MGESLAQFISESDAPNLLAQCHQLPVASKDELIRERDDAGYDVFRKETKEEKEEKKAAERLHLDLHLCSPVLLAEQGERIQLAFKMLEGLGGGGMFQGGRLVRVEIVLDGLAELLPSLEEKYGKPTATSSEELQNAYGATFSAGRAFWQMPDGTLISAIESVEFGPTGYFRSTHVIFESKEEVQRQASSSSRQANPFDH
jgi:hypothetical protein